VPVCSEEIFEPPTGNGSLHEINTDNRNRVANFTTSKNLIVKSMTFHIMTVTKLLGWTDNQTCYILIDGRRHSSVLHVCSFRGTNL
jgi:hypothetical protein